MPVNSWIFSECVVQSFRLKEEKKEEVKLHGCSKLLQVSAIAHEIYRRIKRFSYTIWHLSMK